MASHTKPENIILECVTGSKLYNLDTPDSDTDIKGIYCLPIDDFLGLKEPNSICDHTEPDWVYYEVKKYIQLASRMNPTVSELLWANDYLQLTPIGKMLVENRKLFLSQIARKTYYGYALSQLRKNYRNGSNITNYRFGKHARHIFRLLLQGKELLETGELRVRCTDEERKYIFSFMEMSQDEVFEAFQKKAKEFDQIKSCLPEEPDYSRINALLLDIRYSFQDYYQIKTEREINQLIHEMRKSKKIKL